MNTKCPRCWELTWWRNRRRARRYARLKEQRDIDIWLAALREEP